MKSNKSVLNQKGCNEEKNWKNALSGRCALQVQLKLSLVVLLRTVMLDHKYTKNGHFSKSHYIYIYIALVPLETEVVNICCHREMEISENK